MQEDRTKVIISYGNYKWSACPSHMKMRIQIIMELIKIEHHIYSIMFIMYTLMVPRAPKSEILIKSMTKFLHLPLISFGSNFSM